MAKWMAGGMLACDVSICQSDLREYSTNSQLLLAGMCQHAICILCILWRCISLNDDSCPSYSILLRRGECRASFCRNGNACTAQLSGHYQSKNNLKKKKRYWNSVYVEPFGHDNFIPFQLIRNIFMWMVSSGDSLLEKMPLLKLAYSKRETYLSSAINLSTLLPYKSQTFQICSVYASLNINACAHWESCYCTGRLGCSMSHAEKTHERNGLNEYLMEKHWTQ